MNALLTTFNKARFTYHRAAFKFNCTFPFLMAILSLPLNILLAILCPPLWVALVVLESYSSYKWGQQDAEWIQNTFAYSNLDKLLAWGITQYKSFK